MMHSKSYRVVLTRETVVVETAFAIVEADSADRAEDLAWDFVNNNEFIKVGAYDMSHTATVLGDIP